LGLKFEAGHTSIDSFKKIFGISSRKVEKYVSDKTFFNKNGSDENLKEFR
jgi:hypothetical protein